MTDRIPVNSRLLEHSPATLQPLAQNQAHKLAQQHALVHYGSKAVFSFIPKNACTSLRTSLAVANGTISCEDDWTWIHQNNHTFSATLSELATASKTAIILRCPYKRLVSAFLDKIVSRHNLFWLLHRRAHDKIDPDRFTFRDFVDWIGKPGFLRADIHWRPQIDFFVYRSYDRVFGLHQLDEFAGFFESITGYPYIDARPFSGHTTSAYDELPGALHADTPLSVLTWEKSKGRLPKPNALFDEQLQLKVAMIYKQDVHRYTELIGRDGLLFLD